MGVNGEGVYLYSATRMQDILHHMQLMRPRAMVVDSIQTVYLDDISSSAGSVVQAGPLCSATCAAAFQSPAACTAAQPSRWGNMWLACAK